MRPNETVDAVDAVSRRTGSTDGKADAKRKTQDAGPRRRTRWEMETGCRCQMGEALGVVGLSDVGCRCQMPDVERPAAKGGKEDEAVLAVSESVRL